MRYHHAEHCKAQRWITVFAKCFLHVFRSDVDLYLFEKWVNDDSQFLTFVATVLEFLPGTMYRLRVENFDWKF